MAAARSLHRRRLSCFVFTVRNPPMNAPIRIEQLARNTVEDERGIWVAGPLEEISYPESQHLLYSRIEDDSFWFQHRNAIIAAVVRNHPPSGVIMDVGGGNGYVATGLRNAGFETIVLEPLRTGAENAKRRGLPYVICSSIEQCGLSAQGLPAFGLFDVLEHIENDQHFLRRLHDYMTPQGMLYITVPACRLLWSTDDSYDGHFRRYSSRSLNNRLVAAGFRVQFNSYFFWILPPAIFCFRTLPSLLGLRPKNPELSALRENRRPPGVLGAWLDRYLVRELISIERGRTTCFGSSCIAVAQKI